MSARHLVQIVQKLRSPPTFVGERTIDLGVALQTFGCLYVVSLVAASSVGRSELTSRMSIVLCV